MRRLALTNQILKYSDEQIDSFHALPISKNELSSDYKINSIYKKLLGIQYLKNEVTYGNLWIDNQAFPTGVIEESQKITAETFHSDSSFYITSGTTAANQMAIFSTVKRGDRVLVDKCCHQSIHFALALVGADITYVSPKSQYKKSGRQLTDFSRLLFEFKRANENSHPFELVILNASTYEGVCNNTSLIIEKCLEMNENTTFLVDEAWIAFAYFGKKTKKLSFLSHREELEEHFSNLRVIVTQSAHKSMRSLRQGSYLHLIGDQKFIDKIRSAKYEFGTTSPSYPILASLELAREDMFINGDYYIEKSVNLAEEFKNEISRIPNFKINDELEHLNSPYYMPDPLKVSVDFSETGLDVDSMKKLLKENNIYISRYTDCSFLVNFHIGTSSKGMYKLIEALKSTELMRTILRRVKFLTNI